MVLAHGSPNPLYWSRLEKRSRALRGRNPTRDIQAPVRQWRVRPLIANAVRGRFLASHWTPDLCLRKSYGTAAFWPTSPAQVRFSRMNLFFVPVDRQFLLFSNEECYPNESIAETLAWIRIKGFLTRPKIGALRHFNVGRCDGSGDSKRRREQNYCHYRDAPFPHGQSPKRERVGLQLLTLEHKKR